jgi:hypothetical protein
MMSMVCGEEMESQRDNVEERNGGVVNFFLTFLTEMQSVGFMADALGMNTTDIHNNKITERFDKTYNLYYVKYVARTVTYH